MDALLYVETNYLMGVATGRYDVAHLAGVTSASKRIAIPHSCFMEALAAVEVVMARRKRLSRLLKVRSEKLRTEIFLPRATSAVARLEDARLENDLVGHDVRQRLLSGIEQIIVDAERVVEGDDVLLAAMREAVIGQPTDNLVLHAIVRDATSRPGVKLAFFTENKRDFTSTELAREMLRGAGVVLHSHHDSAVAWLRHA